MKKFSQFGIELPQTGFTGEKIKVNKVLNRVITVHQYKIEKSKFEGKGNCLYMQISLGDNMHVLFTGSKTLMEQIQKVPVDGFPFSATIEEDNERLKFT